MTITKNETSVKFQWGEEHYAVHPLGTIIALASSDSDSVDFKLLSSRKTIYSERFDDIEPCGADAEETAELLANYLN